MKRVVYGFRDERYFHLRCRPYTIAASLQMSDEALLDALLAHSRTFRATLLF